MQAVDHPYCKMMYDSFHAHSEEKSQSHAIAACAAATIHVQGSENDRGVPGTGQVDWDGFFSGLKKTGYDGYLTIDVFGLALPARTFATKVWARPVPRRDGRLAPRWAGTYHVASLYRVRPNSPRAECVFFQN